jgi:hypothetical protein
MIDITIKGNKYQLPNLREIPLSRFIEFLELAETQPDFLKDPEAEYSEFDHAVYAAKELSFWTGCPLADLKRVDISDLLGTWGLQQKNLQIEEDKSVNCFEIENVIYYLPERLMQNSTIEDYAEANEYERNLSEVANGNFKALPLIAAILLRKRDEGFNDYKPEQRAELIEKHLSAWDLFQVAFFLQRQSEKLATDFQISLTSRTIAQLKQVYGN